MRTAIAESDEQVKAIEAEQARWQERLDKQIYAAFPDRDGSGCDSGDPLDVTDAELRQAFNHLDDTLQKLTQAIATLTAERDAAVKVIPKSPGIYAYTCDTDIGRCNYDTGVTVGMLNEYRDFLAKIGGGK